MKYNFETKFMTASTDSTAVAKRLILIIEDMEQLESGKPDPAIEAYLHDTPRAKSEFGAGDAYRVPNINGEPNLQAGPFKGAIVMPEDEFVNHCVKQQAAKIKPAKGEKWPHEKFTSDEYPKEYIPEETKPAESKPKDIEDEEIEIDTVPTDDEPKPEIPQGKKLKSSDIVPQEGTVEDAYLGEHFEVSPDEPEQKPLTPAEQELWDYIQKNPNYTMQSACRDLNITQPNYYWRKRKLYEKGRPVGGAIPFAAKPKD